MSSIFEGEVWTGPVTGGEAGGGQSEGYRMEEHLMREQEEAPDHHAYLESELQMRSLERGRGTRSQTRQPMGSSEVHQLRGEPGRPTPGVFNERNFHQVTRIKGKKTHGTSAADETPGSGRTGWHLDGKKPSSSSRGAARFQFCWRSSQE